MGKPKKAGKRLKASCLPVLLVIPLGLEPKTYCLEGSCSIQLSYGTPLEKSGAKLMLFWRKTKYLQENFFFILLPIACFRFNLYICENESMIANFKNRYL